MAAPKVVGSSPVTNLAVSRAVATAPGVGVAAGAAVDCGTLVFTIPMVGANGPHDYITMGGMFTILKVRENLQGYEDPGWYQAPAETQAKPASTDELIRDGIET